MALYDPDGFLGVIIEQLTTNVTGDIFLTLAYGLTLVVFMALGAGLPAEVSLLIILPVMIVLMAFYGQFVLIGLLIFFFLAAVLAKTFFLR